MSIIDFAIKFFQDSGVAIYFSIAIMAVGMSIAIERFVFLARARAANRRAWSEMLPLLQAGRMREVAPLAQKSDAAVGKIVANALERMHTPHRREDLDAAMEEGMMEIVPRLEKRTHYIATFANVITLVGLLGTIIGLIKGFTAVASVNPAEKAELLSKSISIAMNNTAFALAVAIPFLLIHAFLQARTSEIVDGLEAAKIGFLNLVQRQRGEVTTRNAIRRTPRAPSPRRAPRPHALHPRHPRTARRRAANAPPTSVDHRRTPTPCAPDACASTRPMSKSRPSSTSSSCWCPSCCRPRSSRACRCWT